MYLKSSNLINRIEKINPNPVVNRVKDNPTKKTRGKNTEISAPDMKVTRTSAKIPKKKLTAFESELEMQNNRGSTRIFKKSFALLDTDSAACNKP